MKRSFTVSERLAAIVIKLNRRYYLKVYSTSLCPNFYDEATDSFYGDAGSVRIGVNTQCTIVTGKFNAKIR